MLNDGRCLLGVESWQCKVDSELAWKYSSQGKVRLGMSQWGVIKVPETSALADTSILQVRELTSAFEALH